MKPESFDGTAGRTFAPAHLLADLVRAYEREVNPASDWTETALTEDEFATATSEYRAAKEWLSANIEQIRQMKILFWWCCGVVFAVFIGEVAGMVIWHVWKGGAV